jgi:hypothetical protein
MTYMIDFTLFVATLGLSFAAAFVTQKTALRFMLKAMARR